MIDLFNRCIKSFALIIGVSVSLLGQAPIPARAGKKPWPVIAATAPCNLTVSSLPRFVGVQIEASYEDVLSVYPEIEKDRFFRDKFVTSDSGLFMIQAEKVENKFLLEGAVQISLKFMEKTVAIIAVEYGKDKWNSIQDAVRDYSKIFGIDENSWSIHNNESAVLRCTDFKFYANSIGDSHGRTNSMSIHPDFSLTKFSPDRVK